MKITIRPKSVTGIKLASGLDGKSAYELARQSGYAGSLSQWLASLKGDAGVAGAAGSPGAIGQQGVPGNNGQDGSDFNYTEETFTTSIDLSSPKVLAPKTIDGAITFTPVGTPLIFKPVYVRLIANGLNVPNFGAFVEWGGSLGWVNTVGAVNSVTFFYDGVTSFYSVTQSYTVAAPNPAPDTTPVSPPAVEPTPNPIPPIVNTQNLEILTSMSESGNSTDGYNYTTTTTSWAGNAVSSVNSLVGDGYIQCLFTRTNGLMGFKTTGTAGTYTTWLLGVYIDDAVQAPRIVINGNGGNIPNGALASASYPSYNLYRIRRQGASVFVEASNNAGNTWGVVHTYSNISAELFPAVAGYQGTDGVTAFKMFGLS